LELQSASFCGSGGEGGGARSFILIGGVVVGSVGSRSGCKLRF